MIALTPCNPINSGRDMLSSLIYLDRYRNEGTRTYSEHAAYTEAGEKYRPDSDHSRFELAAFEIPRNQVSVYTANPTVRLSETYLPEGRALFLIHPQILEEQRNYCRLYYIY